MNLPCHDIFFSAFCLPNKIQIILWLPETNKCKTLLNKCHGSHRTDVCLLSKATCNYCWRSDPQCDVSDVGQTHTTSNKPLEVRFTVHGVCKGQIHHHQISDFEGQTAPHGVNYRKSDHHSMASDVEGQIHQCQVWLRCWRSDPPTPVVSCWRSDPPTPCVRCWRPDPPNTTCEMLKVRSTYVTCEMLTVRSTNGRCEMFKVRPTTPGVRCWRSDPPRQVCDVEGQMLKVRPTRHGVNVRVLGRSVEKEDRTTDGSRRQQQPRYGVRLDHPLLCRRRRPTVHHTRRLTKT